LLFIVYNQITQVKKKSWRRATVVKRNYQTELDTVLSGLGETRPRLLLHSCCGPCSSYVLEYLTRWFDVTVLYYNPNIQPEAEYEKRLYWQEQLIRALPTPAPVELMPCAWRGEDFDAAAAGLEAEPEGGERCTVCFALRLEETARRAEEGGFPWFGTTLTVSPHKDAARINTIGQALAEQYGLRWLPSDFKKREGYKRSIQLSAEYGLYRQDYCGCRWSKR
jgi:predicted adenine nucleotide alpha hydrolase (AANH) superfamily ATPase